MSTNLWNLGKQVVYCFQAWPTDNSHRISHFFSTLFWINTEGKTPEAQGGGAIRCRVTTVHPSQLTFTGLYLAEETFLP